MNASQQKVVQYLNEAHATSSALVRVLQSQIAMTPRGSYRTALETHLARRATTPTASVAGAGARPAAPTRSTAVLGVAETVVGQALALGKTPIDLVRGSGGEEKVLKNAKDACATEALEIATYTAIERLARVVGDDETAELAASIRADEEKMLERILARDPQAHRRRRPRRRQGRSLLRRHRDGRRRRRPRRRQGGREPRARRPRRAKRHARQARKVPGVAQAEGRSRAPSPPRATSRSRATTRSPPRRSSAGCRAVADRPREGRLLRAQAPEPHHGPRAHHVAARRRAVGRLRRADRRRGPGRPR